MSLLPSHLSVQLQYFWWKKKEPILSNLDSVSFRCLLDEDSLLAYICFNKDQREKPLLQRLMTLQAKKFCGTQSLPLVSGHWLAEIQATRKIISLVNLKLYNWHSLFFQAGILCYGTVLDLLYLCLLPLKSVEPDELNLPGKDTP